MSKYGIYNKAAKVLDNPKNAHNDVPCIRAAPLRTNA